MMADIIPSVKRLLRPLSGDNEATNENREEQGLPLDEMEVEGVRDRSGLQPPTLDERSEIQTASGILAPGSAEGTAQVQEDPELKGKKLVRGYLRSLPTECLFCE